MKIDAYEFGRIILDGAEYTSDLIIYPDRIDPSWWRHSGHRLVVEDLPEVLKHPPEILVVGTGYSGQMTISSAVRETLRRRGVDLRIFRTEEAVEEFNRLRQSGVRVVAALHLTC